MWTLTNLPSGKQNLRSERLISDKGLICRPKLIAWPMNIYQASLPIFRSMDLLLGLWLDSPVFALLAINTAHPQTLSAVACRWLHFAFPELKLLCCSQIPFISSTLSLPQFTSLCRLTKVWHRFHDSMAPGTFPFFPHRALPLSVIAS